MVDYNTPRGVFGLGSSGPVGPVLFAAVFGGWDFGGWCEWPMLNKQHLVNERRNLAVQFANELGPATTDWLYSKAMEKDHSKKVARWEFLDKVTANTQPNFGPYPIYCLLYTSPSPRDRSLSRMPSSA